MSNDLTLGPVFADSAREAARTGHTTTHQPAASDRAIPPSTRINYGAVLVAAVAPMFASSVYYIVFGDAWLSLRGIDPSTAQLAPEWWQMTGQLVRNLIVAFVWAYLLTRFQVATVGGALRLGLLVWFGFQAMAVAGAVIHEGYPVGLYVIHVGDALMATLIMTFVLGSRRRRPR
jgi:Protein of unknown function (DUF1761)